MLEIKKNYVVSRQSSRASEPTETAREARLGLGLNPLGRARGLLTGRPTARFTPLCHHVGRHRSDRTRRPEAGSGPGRALGGTVRQRAVRVEEDLRPALLVVLELLM